MTERVREILSWYASDNPGTKANLARLLNHGRLIEGTAPLFRPPPLWMALPLFLLAWQVMVTAMMLPSCFGRRACSAPAVRSQRVTRPSSPAQAARLPSGEMATQRMAPLEWPRTPRGRGEA